MSENSKKHVWVWWDRDEPEDGLLGFLTEQDRDNFTTKKPGPYRRIVDPGGKKISQMDDWACMMSEIRQILNNKIIP